MALRRLERSNSCKSSQRVRRDLLGIAPPPPYGIRLSKCTKVQLIQYTLPILLSYQVHNTHLYCIECLHMAFAELTLCKRYLKCMEKTQVDGIHRSRARQKNGIPIHVCASLAKEIKDFLLNR